MQDTLQSSMGRQLENNWNLELTKKRNLTQVNNLVNVKTKIKILIRLFIL